MAQIQQYTSPIDGLRPNDAAQEVAGGAMHIGRLFNEAAQSTREAAATEGGGIKNAGEMAENYLSHREISAGAAAATNLHASINDQWNSLIKSPALDVNDPTIAQQFRDAQEARYAQFQNSFITEKGMDFAQHQVDAMRNDTFRTTESDMGQLASIAVEKNVQDQATVGTAAIFHDPSQYDSQLALAKTSLEHQAMTANLPPDEALRLHGRVYQRVAAAYSEAAIKGTLYGDDDRQPNPQAALDAIHSGKYDNLGGEKLAQLEREAQGEIKTQQADARGEIEWKIKDNQAALSNGDPAPHPEVTPDAVRGAFAGKYAERGNAILDGLQNAAHEGHALKVLSTLAPQERADLIEKFNPKSAPVGASYADHLNAYNALVTANAKFEAGLKSDPAGTVMANTPALQKAYQDAQNDPSKLPRAIALSQQLQDHAGVPEWQQQALPKDLAQNFAGYLMRLPPQDRADTFKQFADKMGDDAFGKFMGSLVTQGGLPHQLEMIPAVVGDANRTALIQGLDPNSKVKEGLGPKMAKDIDNAVDDALGPDSNFRRSFGHVDNGASIIAEYSEGAKKMAYVLVSQGMTPQVAAQRAVASFTTDKYDYVGDARVPKGMGQQVFSAGAAALSALKPEDLAVPNHQTNVSDEYARSEKLRVSTGMNGTWVTNEADTGIVRLDSEGLPVRLANGKRLELLFASMPAVAPVPVNPQGSQSLQEGGVQ